jgi:hypothetical protein
VEPLTTQPLAVHLIAEVMPQIDKLKGALSGAGLATRSEVIIACRTLREIRAALASVDIDEHIVLDARRAGRAEGHAEGYAKGYAAGTQAGYAQAVADLTGYRRLHLVDAG